MSGCVSPPGETRIRLTRWTQLLGVNRPVRVHIVTPVDRLSEWPAIREQLEHLARRGLPVTVVNRSGLELFWRELVASPVPYSVGDTMTHRIAEVGNWTCGVDLAACAPKPEPRKSRKVAKRKVGKRTVAKRTTPVKNYNIPLPHSFGFELSALAPKYSENGFGGLTDACIKRTDRLVSQLRAYLDEVDEYRGTKVARDGHCLEAPSPVFQNFNDAVKFYRYVWAFLTRKGATPHHWKTVCGGGHLHFGVNNLNQIRNLMRNVATHYFLGWVFTQPDDTDSANCALADIDLRRMQVEENCPLVGNNNNVDAYNAYAGVGPWRPTPDEFKYLHGAKALACTGTKQGDTHTVEFRCVEAPKNEDEFADQVEFFARYLAEFKNDTPAPLRFITDEALNAIPQEQAIEDFNRLCRTLNLDPKRYEKYVNRNLKPRWELDRVRT